MINSLNAQDFGSIKDVLYEEEKNITAPMITHDNWQSHY